MTKPMTKLIGEAIRAPHPHTGWLVRVYRYPSGRKLPAPRLLLDHSDPKHLRPWATPGQALDALRQFTTDPRSVPPLRPADTLDSPERPAPTYTMLRRGETLTPPAERPAKRKRKVALPKVAKLLPAVPSQNVRQPDFVRSTIDEWIASGQVQVTRCPTGLTRGMRELTRKTGGMTPGYVDPRNMGDTLEEVEQRQRELLAAPDTRTSRRQRVGKTR